MGIVDEKLAEFDLQGTSYTIELNQNGKIHIHADEFRIDLTKKEFRELVRVSTEARDKIEGYK